MKMSVNECAAGAALYKLIPYCSICTLYCYLNSIHKAPTLVVDGIASLNDRDAAATGIMRYVFHSDTQSVTWLCVGRSCATQLWFIGLLIRIDKFGLIIVREGSASLLVFIKERATISGIRPSERRLLLKGGQLFRVSGQVGDDYY